MRILVPMGTHHMHVHAYPPPASMLRRQEHAQLPLILQPAIAKLCRLRPASCGIGVQPLRCVWLAVRVRVCCVLCAVCCVLCVTNLACVARAAIGVFALVWHAETQIRGLSMYDPTVTVKKLNFIENFEERKLKSPNLYLLKISKVMHQISYVGDRFKFFTI